MSSGQDRSFYGSFEGTGGLLPVNIVGFRPSEVEVLNVDGLATMKWRESMPDASALKEVTAGTKTFETVNGITPLAGGFSLGADADVNVSGEVVHFVARG